MKIDRTKIKKAFAEYVRKYDETDDKIRLKIEHTYRVANLCEVIAESIHLTQNECDIAWLTGMLHDVGRFEQLRRYGTFVDSISIDHAQFGAKLLFEEGLIREFIEDASEDTLLRNAVYYHSVFELPKDLDERTKVFCDILRDADKIDIMKVNIDYPLEEIYNVTTQELKSSQVSPEVMQSFEEEKTTLRALKKTAVDYVAGHLSLVYGLVYPKSRQIIMDNGYLERLLHFQSDNPVTKEQFEQIKERVYEYMNKE